MFLEFQILWDFFLNAWGLYSQPREHMHVKTSVKNKMFNKVVYLWLMRGAFPFWETCPESGKNTLLSLLSLRDLKENPEMCKCVVQSIESKMITFRRKKWFRIWSRVMTIAMYVSQCLFVCVCVHLFICGKFRM